MKWSLIFFLLIAGTCFGQTEHARVYFTEKANIEEVLKDPFSILSEQAVNRKKLRGTTIDERDIPVNENFIAELKNQTGIEVLAKSKWFNCAHVLGEKTDVEALSQLEFVDSIVLLSQPRKKDQIIKQPQPQKKPEETSGFIYGETRNQISMLGVDQLHEQNYTGDGFTIAVMDAGFPGVDKLSGFKRLNEAEKIKGGYDFSNRSINYTNPELHSHGTMVLSTMGGFIKDRFAGTSPDASFYLFVTEVGPTETPVEESYWVEAAERADSLGVDIINTSLGYSLFDDSRYNYSPDEMNGKTAFISRGTNLAMEKGILVVTSAGNSGNQNYFQTVGAPADAYGLTVGAVTPVETYASFSSRGPTADGRIKPDVVAQGQEVAVINEFNQIVKANGTSFSSPLMAGAIASFWQINPEWSNYEVLEMIQQMAHLYNNPNANLGYGIPDFSLGREYIKEEENLDIADQELFLYPNPVENIVKIGNLKNETYILRLFDTNGKLIYISSENEEEIDLSGFSRGIYIAMFEKETFKKSFILIKK